MPERPVLGLVVAGSAASLGLTFLDGIDGFLPVIFVRFRRLILGVLKSSYALIAAAVEGFFQLFNPSSFGIVF